MSNSDDDPHLSAVNIKEFFFSGSGVSALLIHGLTGTPYEMRYLGEQLARTGVRVLGVKLAGHAGEPEELGAVTHVNWYESVVEGFERLRAFGDPNVVIGLSMGALLAARLAIDQAEVVAGIVMLSPAFFLQRLTGFILRALRPLAGLADRVYLHQPGGPDIHDSAARQVHPGNRLMPLGAALNLVELSDYVRPKLAEIEQPCLLIHSRNDHTCPFDRNVKVVMSRRASEDRRLVELAESFHIITVDSEKHRVALEIADFVNEFRIHAGARAVGG